MSQVPPEPDRPPMIRDAGSANDGAGRGANPLQLLALLVLAAGIIWLLVTLGKSNPYPEQIKSAEELVSIDYLNNSSNSIANPDGGYVGDGEAERELEDLKAEGQSWDRSRTTQTYVSLGVALLGAVLLVAALASSSSRTKPQLAGSASESGPQSDLRSRLDVLAALQDAGEISEAEYKQQRARLLDEL